MSETPINPGIVKTVRLLNEACYKTCDSGDGETHDFPCDRDFGYVVVNTDPAAMVFESQDIMQLLDEHGYPLDKGDGTGVLITACYSPLDGMAHVDISQIHDSMAASSEEKADE